MSRYRSRVSERAPTLFEAVGGADGVLRADVPDGLRIPRWSWGGLQE